MKDSKFAEKILGLELTNFQIEYLDSEEKLGKANASRDPNFNFFFYAIIKHLNKEYKAKKWRIMNYGQWKKRELIGE